MDIHLSDHFTYSRLIRFTLPAISMMVVTSLYTVVDGFFVSNFAGKNALAAITLIFPVLGILASLGFMMGTGGAALVGKRLGQGRKADARRAFSLLVCATFFVGLVLASLGQVFIQDIAVLLGAEGEMLAGSVLYARISLVSLPFFMLQFFFQTFFSTAEKPRLGLLVTVAAGCANILLDAVFVALCGWGLMGAALATAISEFLGGGLPLFYFARKNTSLLRLTWPRFSLRDLLKAGGNGASEFLNNIAFSFLMMLYNWQLLRLAGETGVAAFGILLYVTFIFATIFGGYAIGSSPLVSYNFGANRRTELQNIFRKSLVLNSLAGLGIGLFCAVAAGPFARLFTGYDAALCELTTRAIRLFAPTFFFSWATVFGSAFFTALNNGAISALIAVLHMFVFGGLAILLLPALLGLDGVWCAWPVAELLSLLATAFFLLRCRKTYGYA